MQLADITEWRGDDVVDIGGEKIGTLEVVYYDAETDEPLFLGLKAGLLPPHLTFVPVAGLSVGKHRLVTDQAKSVVRSAPTIGLADELPEDLEPKIFEHYEIPYHPAKSPSGRRLARR
ncbi:MAG: PRC-barrel domain-containing protein [Candidatus Dormibacteria bacterium]